jgi:hypothetical protein
LDWGHTAPPPDKGELWDAIHHQCGAERAEAVRGRGCL